MQYNIRKFKKICREKGIFIAFLETIRYLMFILRKNRLERIWAQACLKSGRLEIRGWNTGPKIYWDDLELTKMAGLNTSIFVNGKWRDSSKANWRPLEIRPNSLVLENAWRTLPIRQIWTMSNLGDGRIGCDVELETRKDMEFIEQKFTIMVDEKFDLWFDAANEPSTFQRFKNWTDIKEVKKESPFIGVQSDMARDLPRIILKRSDMQPPGYPQVQNSDYKTRGRLLNLIVSSRDTTLEYKKGQNGFFKVEIDVQ